MNHYTVLGISEKATQTEIKKAYRAMAMKYHPDKNSGSKSAEDQFKKISSAYEILSDPAKRRIYDAGRVKKTNNFDDFIKNEFGGAGFRSNFNHSRNKHWGWNMDNERVVDTSHLDISITHEISMLNAIIGEKIKITYERTIVKYENDNYAGPGEKSKIIENKEIQISINLREQFVLLKRVDGKLIAKIRVSHMGNEDFHSRLNGWGSIEYLPIFGNLYIELHIIEEDSIKFDGEDIIQTVPISLYSILSSEKIRIETLFDKKYDAELSSPTFLSNLKFVLPNQGILNEAKNLGKYIVKFDVITPKVEELSNDSRDKFMSILKDI
jgi:curved DNA-binding protein